MNLNSIFIWLLTLAVALGMVSCSKAPAPKPKEMASSVATTRSAPRDYSQRIGTIFTPVPDPLYTLRTAQEVSIPDFPGANAIWGATGRDNRGHIWFGVSADLVEIPSAHLFEYIPETGELYDRGDVVNELKRLGIYREGESQMKIHTKILHAEDDFLYFASMDEKGEHTNGTLPPAWGSHFWRFSHTDNHWEHLLHVPKGVIAMAGMGRWIYALGYFGHVLYQFDCRMGKFQSVGVGSEGGHISRNFASDKYGKAYVPRVKRYAVDIGKTNATPPNVFKSLESTLVEFDTNLQEIAEFPLTHYDPDLSEKSHGITGIAYLADGTFVFTTHTGFLYRVFPQPDRPAEVVSLGWFHPRGAAYCPSLFTISGERYIVGVSTIKPSRKYEWIIYDMDKKSSKAVPLELAQQMQDSGTRPKLLLYGSITRDNNGDYYIAGRYHRNTDARKVPLLWRVRNR